jgi:hypothetical protein
VAIERQAVRLEARAGTVGRLHLAGRFRFSSAVGMQIAATTFHTYDHRLMISTRVSF